MAITLSMRTGKRSRFVSPHMVNYNGVPVVYFVPHQSGWYLYALSAGRPLITVNNRVIEAGLRLQLGDRISISTKEFVVEDIGPTNAPSFESGTIANGCRVSIAGGESVVVAEQLLIGRSRQCELRVDHPDVRWVHALVARIEDRWLLYDLTGGHMKDAARPPWVPIIAGREPTIHPLALKIELLGVQASPDVSPPSPLPPSTIEIGPRLANQICRWVRQILRNPRTPLLTLTRRLPVTADEETVAILRDLEQYLKRIKKNRADRLALLELANELSNLGFQKAYRTILRERLIRFPNDAALLRTLSKEYVALGNNTTYTDEIRLQCFDKAIGYLDRLMVLAGEWPDLQEQRKSLAATRAELARQRT